MDCDDSETSVTFKRTAQFYALCEYTPAEGGLSNLLGTVVTSQVRTRTGTLVADLTALMADDGLSFTLTCDDTSTWPLDTLLWDVCVTFDGVRILTSTVTIACVQNVTD